jgi:hypothetical protein
MKKDVYYMPPERANDGYEAARTMVASSLKAFETNHWRIFDVGGNGLFELYLNSLPEAARQHYNCHACHRFFSRYGGLVAVNKVSLEKKAIFWEHVGLPKVFQKAMDALKAEVLSRPIRKYVRFTERELGIPVTGAWSHFYGKVPEALYLRQPAESYVKDVNTAHEIIERVMTEFTKEQINKAVNFLSGGIYRASEVLPMAKWVLETYTYVEANTSKKDVFLWLRSAEHPTYCHFKSSTLGALLDAIKEGKSDAVLKTMFETLMDPNNYHRSQSAPSVTAVENAEKKIQELGLAESLRRRYVEFDEVKDHAIWMPKEEATKDTGGVFAKVKEVAKQKPVDVKQIKNKMTWAKFSRDILPDAKSIKVRVNTSRKVSMTAPAVEGTKNIIKWGNGFAWTYSGGVDGSMRERVLKAGGRFDNVPLRATISWESYTDLDLHCTTPGNEHIFFGHKESNDRNGFLDVDANGGRPTTREPVENIVFDTIKAGLWRFYIHNYADRNHNENPYKAELCVNGQVWHAEGFLGATDSQEDLFRFKYKDGQITDVIVPHLTGETTEEGDFPEVAGIIPSPNTWDGKDIGQKHLFFILKGAKAIGGRGFYNEFLTAELQDIRKVLEIYAGQTQVEGEDNSSASGVGYALDIDWNLELFVETSNGQRHILIDRYE